jgi:hypothetical protein
MDLHRLGELRSRAYHEAIARRLVDDPEVIERARARVEAWARAGTIHPSLAAGWRGVLALPPPELAARLGGDDPEIVQLRSASPFAGELSPRARWALWRVTRDHAGS